MMLDPTGRPLVAAHVCWDDHEAEMVVSFLAAQGIVAAVNSRLAHSILPLTVDGIGEIQVLVSQDDVEVARAAIERQCAESGRQAGDENEV